MCVRDLSKLKDARTGVFEHLCNKCIYFYMFHDMNCCVQEHRRSHMIDVLLCKGSVKFKFITLQNVLIFIHFQDVKMWFRITHYFNVYIVAYSLSEKGETGVTCYKRQNMIKYTLIKLENL